MPTAYLLPISKHGIPPLILQSTTTASTFTTFSAIWVWPFPAKDRLLQAFELVQLSLEYCTDSQLIVMELAIQERVKQWAAEHIAAGEVFAPVDRLELQPVDLQLLQAWRTIGAYGDPLYRAPSMQGATPELTKFIRQLPAEIRMKDWTPPFGHTV